MWPLVMYSNYFEIVSTVTFCSVGDIFCVGPGGTLAKTKQQAHNKYHMVRPLITHITLRILRTYLLINHKIPCWYYCYCTHFTCSLVEQLMYILTSQRPDVAAVVKSADESN